MIKKCRICGHNKVSHKYQEKQYHYFVCKRCGVVFLDNNFSEEDIDNIYNKDKYLSQSYKYGKDDEGNKNYFSNQERLKQHAENNLSEVERVLFDCSIDVGNKLLDVGCAAGFFLDVARSKGYDVNGVEISKEGVEHAINVLKLNIVANDLFDIGDRYNSYFDIVTMFDVLEHLPNPHESLEKINLILRPGGILVIEVPNIKTIDRFKRAILLSILQPPHHLFIYSPNNLKILLGKHGFACVHEKYYPSDLIGRFLTKLFSLVKINKIVDEKLAVGKMIEKGIKNNKEVRVGLAVKARNLIKYFFPGSKMRMIFVKQK